MDIPMMPSGMDSYGAINDLDKLLKKEQKKGSKAENLKQKISQFSLVAEEVKEAIAETLKEEGFGDVNPTDDMIEDIVFGLSLGKIFEKDNDGNEKLKEKLKKALQLYSAESQEAKTAVAHQLSEGSQGDVPSDAKLVQKDIDAISLKTIENPKILFN